MKTIKEPSPIFQPTGIRQGNLFHHDELFEINDDVIELSNFKFKNLDLYESLKVYTTQPIAPQALEVLIRNCNIDSLEISRFRKKFLQYDGHLPVITVQDCTIKSIKIDNSSLHTFGLQNSRVSSGIEILESKIFHLDLWNSVINRVYTENLQLNHLLVRRTIVSGLLINQSQIVLGIFEDVLQSSLELTKTRVISLVFRDAHLNKLALLLSEIVSFSKVDSEFDDYSLSDFSIRKGNELDFLYLKKMCLDRGDLLNASYFRSRQLYAIMLQSWSSRDYTQWFQLFLNYVSNNFGQRWFQAAFFTWLIGTIGFLFSVFLSDANLQPALSLTGFEYIYHNYSYFYGQIFNPVGNINFLSESDNPFWTSVVNLITRIFVIYGVYQTATAFRKYGKL